MYVHELSLEARPASRSSPKFKSPNIFPLTDSPNILLAKFSRYTVFTSFYILTPLGVQNKGGRTPLGDAVCNNQFEVVQYLINDHGVDVNGMLLLSHRC